MRKGVLGLLAMGTLAALLLVPATARADWTSGPWMGRPIFRGGAFIGCVMETAYTPGGRRFKFMQLANYELLVGLSRKARPFERGQVHNMLMQIDGEIIRRAVGIVRPHQPNTLWINLGTDRFARQKLKEGNTLILHRTGGKAATRSLAGTYNALNRLEACVRDRN
jgi:hypothetical protein